MAVCAEKMVGECDDSSSSDDEALRRCQEAVWETRTTTKTEDGDNGKPSKRVVVTDHEHDGNELQVTQGFRTHVAKKLGCFLDSHISEMQVEASSCVNSAECEDDDEGFRLFSTSVPGQIAEDPPPPVRRRPIPSSSDSDSEMEMRLKEAAVSFKDLVPSSLHSMLTAPSAEPPCSDIKKKKKLSGTDERHRLKKKRNQDGNEVESPGSANVQSSGENAKSEQEHNKVKRKKNKRRKGNTEESLN